MFTTNIPQLAKTKVGIPNGEYDVVQDPGYISYSQPFRSLFCIRLSIFDLVKKFVWLLNDPLRRKNQGKIQKKNYKTEKHGKKAKIE